jgi:hypothetical protein
MRSVNIRNFSSVKDLDMSVTSQKNPYIIDVDNSELSAYQINAFRQLLNIQKDSIYSANFSLPLNGSNRLNMVKGHRLSAVVLTEMLKSTNHYHYCRDYEFDGDLFNESQELWKELELAVQRGVKFIFVLEKLNFSGEYYQKLKELNDRANPNSFLVFTIEKIKTRLNGEMLNFFDNNYFSISDSVMYRQEAKTIPPNRSSFTWSFNNKEYSSYIKEMFYTLENEKSELP